MTKNISFTKGLKYPWGNAKKLWNILWALIPVLGWLALIGYCQKIIQSLAKANFKGLPKFGSFWDNLGTGIVLLLKYIPTAAVIWIIGMIPVIGWIAAVAINIFILPWLFVNFMVKDKFSALWEIQKATNAVVKNIKAYVIAFVKTLVFTIIYGIASIILIGIPCLSFGSMTYLVDFYNHHKK